MRKGLVALVAVCFFSSCLKRVEFDKNELAHLDGFDVYNERTVYVPGMMPVTNGKTTTMMPTTVPATVTDRPYRMIDRDGQVFDFNSNSRLYLICRDRPEQGGRFKNVAVNVERFRGSLMEGGLVDVPLEQVGHARSEERRVGKG